MKFVSTLFLMVCSLSLWAHDLVKRPYMAGQNIAVVGAGVSGISIVRALLAKGVPAADVTVIEKNSTAGGKVSTLNFEGRPYEVGAAVIIRGRYKLIEDLAAHHGLTTRPLGPTKFLDLQTGAAMPDLTEAEVQEFRAQVGFYLKKYETEWKSVSGPLGYSKLPADLELTWNDFLAKYNDKIGKLIFRLSTALGGSGYVVTQNPPYAAQLIRYINPSLLMSVLGKDNVRIFDSARGACVSGMRNDPMGGFQCLWIREAEELKKKGVTFMYDTEIVSIDRGAKVALHAFNHRKKSNHDQTFDHVFYTPDFRYLLKGQRSHRSVLKDMTSQEKKLFGSIETYPYRTYVLRMTNFPSDASQLYGILPYMRTGENKKGVLVERPYADNNVYQMWAYGGKDVSHDEILKGFEQDMLKLGATFDKRSDLISSHTYEYFPHVKPGSGYTLSSFFNQVMSRQGAGGLWLAGEVLGFGLTIDVYEQGLAFGEMFVDNKL